MPVRFILLCVLDIEGESRNPHGYTHQSVFFLNLKSPRTKPSTPNFTAVVVAKQRSRSKQDKRVFLSGYNPVLALKQIKLE